MSYLISFFTLSPTQLIKSLMRFIWFLRFGFSFSTFMNRYLNNSFPNKPWHHSPAFNQSGSTTPHEINLLYYFDDFVRFVVKKIEKRGCLFWRAFLVLSHVRFRRKLHTMGSVPVNKITDHYELTCGICNETYKNPKVLPCLHSFCQNCLDSKIR